MAINVNWDNLEHTVIHFHYVGQWTFNDLFTALQQARDMMETVNHPVHGIIDLSESKLLPNGALSLGRNVTMRKHPNQGRTAIVGANGFTRTLYDVFRKVYRTSFDESLYIFVDSLEEARLKLGVQLVV